MVVHDTRDASHQEVGRVALDDICAAMAHSHGLSYSNNLLVALSERGIPFVLCAANHKPVGMLWPVDGHHEQARRIDAQLTMGATTPKHLWAAIVAAKLANQAAVLRTIGFPSARLERLASHVKSGDPENLEAQGAKHYWHQLFGDPFRRNPDAPGVNALLNYGYTVFRAAMARAVIAAGLHPSIGLHHSNDGNAMRLVDDLIEPFRPFVDHQVWQCQQAGTNELTPDVKRQLVHALYQDLRYPNGLSPLSVGMERLATSLAQVLLQQRDQLELPHWASSPPNG